MTAASQKDAAEHRGYTIEAQLGCIRRELALRQKVYPRWVKAGRMRSEEADHEINCMQAVHDTLVGLQEPKPRP